MFAANSALLIITKVFGKKSHVSIKTAQERSQKRNGKEKESKNNGISVGTGSAMEFKARILTEENVNRTLVRMAHQIIERNHGTEGLCLVGIRTRGVPLSARIGANIERITGEGLPVGELDITLYRDDLSRVAADPIITESILPFSIVGKTVVLVDDVIFTGRTARAALDAVMAHGRPARIQLAVLIDRGHTELPIKPNFVGKNIPTSLDEIVSVQLKETDGQTGVSIYTK